MELVHDGGRGQAGVHNLRLRQTGTVRSASSRLAEEIERRVAMGHQKRGDNMRKHNRLRRNVWRFVITCALVLGVLAGVIPVRDTVEAQSRLASATDDVAATPLEFMPMSTGGP